MIAPDAYTLPFKPEFNAPLGAVLVCLGMRGWRFRDPQTGADVVFRDREANSYARHTGGMEGTRWVVSSVQPSSTSEAGFDVTLEAE